MVSRAELQPVVTAILQDCLRLEAEETDEGNTRVGLYCYDGEEKVEIDSIIIPRNLSVFS